MRKPAQKVCVYVFDIKDERKPEERLKSAVAEYCREWSLEAVRPEVLRVERTESGKPYFPDCPRIQFSISHSGDYWACAVAEKSVGLDIQEHVRKKSETREAAAARFLKMAHRFFHPVEAKFVELDSCPNFFTVWTAREAYVKYTGQGIDKHFSEYCVVPEQEEQWPYIADQTEETTWQALGKWFWKSGYGKGYSLCVCTEEPCECVIVPRIQEQ